MYSHRKVTEPVRVFKSPKVRKFRALCRPNGLAESLLWTSAGDATGSGVVKLLGVEGDVACESRAAGCFRRRSGSRGQANDLVPGGEAGVHFVSVGTRGEGGGGGAGSAVISR
jgi:hypothetical protein